jgi:hypothetical protein
MHRATVLLFLALLAVPGAAPFTIDVETAEGLAPRPVWENTPGVAATFEHASYAPGDKATLVLWRAERGLRVRVFRVGPEHARTVGNVTMEGAPVTPALELGPRAAHRPIPLSVGDWPSGLYFARLTAPDGRVGFAPFVVRPRALGEHRVLVVLPTYTWQAYNFRDDDGDGRGDTWYAGWKQDWAPLDRPFLARGVPPHFRQYDLAFLHWLAQTGRDVDFFSDDDLARAPSARSLADAYDLVVFPGHHEYVTTREYDLVEGYRDLGGNLAFLAANDFFWRIVIRHRVMTRTAQWRDLGRPEAALVGVQFIGTDEGHHRGPWQVRADSPLFHDVPRSFGSGGIEIDHTSADSPPGIHVLAEIPHLFGDRFTAQMTEYETPAGAKVFAAGAFTLAGSATHGDVAALLANLWQRLSTP